MVDTLCLNQKEIQMIIFNKNGGIDSNSLNDNLQIIKVAFEGNITWK